MNQFGNMDNYNQMNQMMNQGQFIQPYGQQQQFNQQQQIDPNQMQQLYQNQQVDNFECFDDDEDDEALDMMTPEQIEQYKLFKMMQQQGGQNQMNMGQMNPIQQMAPMGQMPVSMTSTQQQQVPAQAALQQPQQESETAQSSTSTSTGLGLKKKKMRLNPNANSFIPEAPKPQEQQQQQQQQQFMPQQQYQMPMMDMNYMMQMGMNPMMMPPMMGMPMNFMGMGMGMGMPQPFMEMPFQISQDNMRMFQELNKKKKIGTTAGGIVSFGASEKIKKKKKKDAVEGDKPKKPKVFKKKADDQPKTLVKKQMVKEDELFKMESDFDYSNGLLHQVDESRQPLNIVFIGHVDAGKSTICGNILVKSGKVDPLELKKFEAEAKTNQRDTWFLAYIMDTSIEERLKGKTVEVGKATFQTPSKRFTLLDAPGHKNYVPNMLAGASQSDVACLVVSAKTGEFESGFEKDGQTREHAMLVRSLGCQYMIVVVNKMDECEWNFERYTTIKDALSPFLEKTCGLNLQTEVAWCPISGLTGENLQEKNAKNPLSDWYKGLTLFEMLDSVPLPERNPNTDLRIPVLDYLKDVGLFVFGKVESGIIVQGQQVTMMPYQTVFTVQRIFNADDQCVPYGKPGENVKLKVKDIEEDDIKRGFVICNNEDFCQFCYELEAELQILELPEHKSILSAGYTCVIHVHTIQEEVEISHIIARKQAGESIATSFLKSGMTGLVRISSKSYLCVEKYAKEIHLGSFTLRDEGRTIAIGKILRIKPAKKLPRLEPKEETIDLTKPVEQKTE